MEDWNKQLKELYTKARWDELWDICDEYETWPYMLKINEELYKISDLKIMIFGKETNGWVAPNENWTCDKSERIDMYMNLYDEFTCSGKLANVKYGYQFWNYIKMLNKKLVEKGNDKNIYLIMNNVLKIGTYKIGTPNKNIVDLGEKYFPLIEEINILKPDFILFLSGHNYDKYISRDVHIEKELVKNKLVQLKIPGFPISFRTEHPRTMNFQWTKDEYELVFSEIIDSILITPN